MATKGNEPVSAESPPQRASGRGGAGNGTDQSPDGFEAVRRQYPPILNTAQVAELLDLNARTVLNMAGDGRLPASRLPGSRKFHFLLEDIIRTLKANRISPD